MKHIGVLGSNLSGSGFDGIRIAKELGARVTFFTRDLNRYLSAPGGPRCFAEHVDEVVVCETNELEAVLERVRAVQPHLPFSGFMTMGDYDVIVAAQVAAELGLPTPDPAAVRTARNKALMRRRCAERGIPMPAFRTADSAAAVAAAAAELGFPCVVKPADETSGADVRRCARVEEAVEQFHAIRSKPRNIRGQRRYHEILIEECVTGYEVSVEVLASGTGQHVLGVTDKTVGGRDRFIELGHVFPSMFPAPVRTACELVAVEALRAVGFDLGMAHVEVKYTAEGPKLIEINPRPAGGKVTDLVDLALGTSCLEIIVRQYLGEHVDAEVPSANVPSANVPSANVPGANVPGTAVRGAAVRYLTADPGEVTAITGLDVAAGIPGVREVLVPLRPGDRVNPLRNNFDRVGHVLTVAEDPYVALRTAETAANEIAVLTTPG
jgi:biotin carboxylase